MCFFSRCLWIIIDQNELLAARQFLEQAAASNIAEFLKALSEVLANINCSSVARTASGLQLKNHLTSKDASITEQYHKQWLSFPEVTREYIKTNVSFYFCRFRFICNCWIFFICNQPNWICSCRMFRLCKRWEQKRRVHHQLHNVWLPLLSPNSL